MGDSTLTQRPANVFLSYKREDEEEVIALQNQLFLRGVQAWRDATHLALGGYTREEIVRAIKEESDAFLLYVTPRSLASNFIWDVEVPAALERWRRDHAFAIVPVLCGVSLDQLRQHCIDHDIGEDITEFNGIELPAPADEKSTAVLDRLREVARQVLHATLKLHLRAISADRSYEPSLCLRTDHYAIDEDDLDLNWIEFFPHDNRSRWPSEQEWQQNLLPALYDVRHALGSLTRNRLLHVTIHARLPAAFAFGFVFGRTTGFRLALEADQFSCRTDSAAY